MKDATLPTVNRLEYYEARRIAEETGQTTEQAIRDHHISQLTEKLPTAETKRLRAEREKLEKKQAELAEAERSQAQKYAQWESLLTSRDRLRAALAYGADQIMNCDEEAGRIEFIKEQLGNQHGAFNYPIQLIELGKAIASIRILKEIYPAWKAEKEAELAKILAEIETFAKANGIPLK